VTHTVPVYEGFSLPFATMKIDLAGRDITLYLQKLLAERGFDFSNSSDREKVEQIKEKKGVLAYDFDAWIKESQEPNPKEVLYSLPDGTNISLINEHFKCPEALFQPLKLSREVQGIHELAYQSILKCEIHIRRDLYGNIILAGGSTMFPGMNARLTKEISALAPSTMKIKVKSPQERKFSTWIGGSILSSLKAFESIWVTASDYKEFGDSIVHKKCF
jgi:actin